MGTLGRWLLLDRGSWSVTHAPMNPVTTLGPVGGPDRPTRNLAWQGLATLPSSLCTRQGSRIMADGINLFLQKHAEP